MKFVLFSSMVLCLTACNTVEGIGEDLRTAVDSIERAASQNRSSAAPPPPPQEEDNNKRRY